MSPPASTLARPEQPDAGEKDAHPNLEAGQGRNTVQMSGASTRAHSLEYEKHERSSSDEDGILATSVEDAGDYPQGVALAFIVVALSLSIFLVALDMVSPPSPELRRC